MSDPALLSEVILNDDQLHAIGCLVIESTHLETYIERMIVLFCDNEPLSDLLLGRGNMMLKAKIDLLKALMSRALTKPRRKRLESLCDAMITDAQKRNTVVHGDWGLARELTLENLVNLRNSGNAVAVRKASAASIKASSIKSLARRFADHQKALIFLWMEYRQSLPSTHTLSLKSPRRTRLGLGNRIRKPSKSQGPL